MPLNLIQLQQPLPFTVLKLSSSFCLSSLIILAVATALTVYGIETRFLLRDIVFHKWLVATALTVYGIETFLSPDIMTDIISLQQPLPFTVLKPFQNISLLFQFLCLLQQPLPFTVLKPTKNFTTITNNFSSCNSPYRLRYWNEAIWCDMISTSPLATLQQPLPFTVLKLRTFYFNATVDFCCNSTYRLRYWNVNYDK